MAPYAGFDCRKPKVPLRCRFLCIYVYNFTEPCNKVDYVDDPCMVMFTKGQADRMLATINAYRSGLLENSINCLTPYNSENNQLTIYPNPGSELFVCRYGIAPMGIVKYEIYNSIGHLIKYENKIINHEFIIDLQTFSAGIYFLKVGGNIYKLVKT